jgi:hypothetical protein
MAAPTFRVHPNCMHGVLAEDFIVTAKATQQPFIRVKFDDLPAQDDVTSYPLVALITFFLLHPLKKGDGVTVFLPSDSTNSYQIYAIDKELPKPLFDDPTFPSDGQVVTFPQPTKLLTFQYFSDDFYFIVMEGATLFVSGDVRTLYLPKRVISYCPSDGSYEVKTGKFFVEASDALTLVAGNGYSLTSTNKFIMQSNNIQLKAIVAKLFEFVGDLYTKMGTIYSTDLNALASAANAPGATSALLPSYVAPAVAASSKSIEVSTFKSTNVDIFFQE